MVISVTRTERGQPTQIVESRGAVRNKVTTLATFTGTGTSSAVAAISPSGRIHVESDASHTGTTDVDILLAGELDDTYINIGTVSVTGNSDADGIAIPELWPYIKVQCTAHGDSTNAVTVKLIEV